MSSGQKSSLKRSIVFCHSIRVWIYLFLLFTIITRIEADSSTKSDDDSGELKDFNNHVSNYLSNLYQPEPCGPHPLQSILDHYGGKLSHTTIVQLLIQLRRRARRLWTAYENAVSRYTTCILATGSGTLG